MGLVYIHVQCESETMSVREELKPLLHYAISRVGAPCVVLKLLEKAVKSLYSVSRAVTLLRSGPTSLWTPALSPV